MNIIQKSVVSNSCTEITRQDVQYTKVIIPAVGVSPDFLIGLKEVSINGPSGTPHTLIDAIGTSLVSNNIHMTVADHTMMMNFVRLTWLHDSKIRERIGVACNEVLDDEHITAIMSEFRACIVVVKVEQRSYMKIYVPSEGVVSSIPVVMLTNRGNMYSVLKIDKELLVMTANASIPLIDTAVDVVLANYFGKKVTLADVMTYMYHALIPTRG